MITATVVVTTRNRQDDLRVCLRSAQAQVPAVEVVVIDDGSTDGTAGMVRQEFPGVTIVSHRESAGYIRRRNEAARVAAGDVVVSLDDDAAFSSADIVRQTLADFNDDRVAAVAIPYIDVNRDPQLRQAAPDRSASYVTESFIGTAHAIRRDVFLKLDGYREALFHQGEESDFCIRLLAAGYVVKLGTSDPIHHFESPKRDFRRMDHFGPRNAILFAWQNVPFPAVLIHLPVTFARVAMLTLAPSRFVTRLGGALSGLALCLSQGRAPVPLAAYSLWRRMRTVGAPLTLAEVAGELVPLHP